MVSRHSSAAIAARVVTSTTTLLTMLPSVLVTAVLRADDVVVQPAGERAGLGAGEERDRHALHLGEQRHPQVVDDALTDGGAAPPLHDGQTGVGHARQPPQSQPVR